MYHSADRSKVTSQTLSGATMKLGHLSGLHPMPHKHTTQAKEFLFFLQFNQVMH